ncbi:MAG: tetratricopeptide repeat protein [Alphaproteobacteria bacterium]|nr:tetratricopeptide repeat protein [Alphaproteobacteria bacterium]
MRQFTNRSNSLLAGCLAVVTAAWLAWPAQADTQQDCFGPENPRRIEACTKLLELPLPPAERSYAFAMRALAYSIQGLYDRAIPDYDKAIEISPDFAVALNNRAWAYLKDGQPDKARPDVTRALELSPFSPHALDTRAHLRQVEGDQDGALSDYMAAMRYGGARMVKLYQCGLQANGLYNGGLTGLINENLRGALETCVKSTKCDPLPADEECRRLTS